MMPRLGHLSAIVVGMASFVLSITAATAATPPSQTPPNIPHLINSTFRGSCWLNAQLCQGQTMTARVGDTVCATDSNPVVPTDGQIGCSLR